MYTELYRYLSFLYDTWSSLAIMVTFGGVSVFDLGSMLVYAVGGTILLLFVLIFCLVFTIRPVTDAYKRWSERLGFNISLGLANVDTNCIVFSLKSWRWL